MAVEHCATTAALRQSHQKNSFELLLPKYSKNFATIRALIWGFPAGGWDGALHCAGVFTGKIKTSVCKFDKVKSFVGERGLNAEE